MAIKATCGSSAEIPGFCYWDMFFILDQTCCNVHGLPLQSGWNNFFFSQIVVALVNFNCICVFPHCKKDIETMECVQSRATELGKVWSTSLTGNG